MWATDLGLNRGSKPFIMSVFIKSILSQSANSGERAPQIKKCLEIQSIMLYNSTPAGVIQIQRIRHISTVCDILHGA
jgi:hypothetical protein